MNQLFNFSRFGRLFRKHTTEHAGGYLLATGVLLGGIGLVLGFVAYTSWEPMAPDMQGVVFVLGLLAAGAFFTSTVFAMFGEKKQAAAALLLPASHWEKYLVGWLYSLPLFLAVYVGCFFLIDRLVLQLSSHGKPFEMVQLFDGERHLYFSLVAYAAWNAVFLWGSIFFAKQHFVRTAFGVLLAVVVVAQLNTQVMEHLVGRELRQVLPFAGILLREGPEAQLVGLAPAQYRWFALVPLGFMLLAWTAAYRRVTEKQL